MHAFLLELEGVQSILNIGIGIACRIRLFSGILGVSLQRITALKHSLVDELIGVLNTALHVAR